MLRTWGAVAGAALIIVSASSAVLAGSDKAALPVGKAAGVKQALDMGGSGTALLIGGGLVAGGLALVLTGNDNGSASNTTSSTTLP